MKECYLKRTIVYPYDEEFTPLLRYSSRLKEENICKIISPPSWGLVGKDAGIADGGKDIGINVDGDTSQICEYDRLVVPQCANEHKIHKRLISIIIEMLNQGKEVICLMHLAEDEVNTFLKYEGFKYFCKDNKTIKLTKDVTLNRINVPVIGVCGLLDNINKFDVLLVLNEMLSKDGYLVETISPKKYGEYLGYYTYPDLIYRNTVSIEDKINCLNSFVKSIEMGRNPDAILIEIPGGIMPYDSMVTNHYGVLSYIVFNAIAFDYVCLNMPYSSPNSNYLDLLKQIMYYRYNSSIDCFYISNKQIFPSNFADGKDPDRICFDYITMKKKIQAMSDLAGQYDIFNFQNDDQANLYEHLLRNMVDKSNEEAS